MVYSEHEDFIADITYSARHKTLIAVGGDGYLSTWDLRKPDVAAMSDQLEDELLSVSVVKVKFIKSHHKAYTKRIYIIER
jgi:WD40 repeat protein